MEKDIRSVLSECGFGFKKSLGQNFLTDKNLLSSIVEISGSSENDTVVEIGCGAGTLTCALAQKAKKVLAYEIDKSLMPVLAQTLAGIDNAEVVFADFMKEDIKKLEDTVGEYRVVANLPYYVTTPIIMKILEGAKSCKSLTVMVQKEVAERLCAEAGTPEYGAITAQVAFRAKAEIKKIVPSSMFFPRPKVDSAVVNLIIEDGRVPAKSACVYKKCVQAGFSARRKTLVNNLINAFSINREEAEKLLSLSGIDLKARGETLSPQKFAELSDRLCDFTGN